MSQGKILTIVVLTALLSYEARALKNTEECNFDDAASTALTALLNGCVASCGSNNACQTTCHTNEVAVAFGCKPPSPPSK